MCNGIEGDWDKHLSLMEFTYNNNYHDSIKMAPFEALYGRKCRSPVRWFKPRETKLIGLDLVIDAMQKVQLIKERLQATQDRQKSYANIKRHNLEFSEGDHVFLMVSSMKGVMRFGKKAKLAPRQCFETRSDHRSDKMTESRLDRFNWLNLMVEPVNIFLYL